MLGESGVAFATGATTTTDGTNQPVSQLASFNIADGSPNWTYQAPVGSSLTIIAATSGNGLVAKTTDQSNDDTVLTFDSTGTQQQGEQEQSRFASTWSVARPMDSSESLSGFSNVDYYNNGWWIGTSSGNPVAILGSIVQAATSSSPRPKGNGTKQNSYVPVIENFEPFDPGSNIPAAGFETRYDGTNIASGMSLGSVTHAIFNVSQKATWEEFSKQVSKPNDAVAYIGHASISPFEVNGITRAVGLCFYNFECEERLAVPGDPEYSPGFLGLSAPPGGTNAYPVDFPPTQTKILFIAACNLDTNMQSWIGISSSTVGRALIVPQSNTEVILNMGEFAWEDILRHLYDFPGVTTLRTAVAAANVDINGQQWFDSNHNPVAPVNWQVIGDGSIHF